MKEIVLVNLENEMDLIIAHKRAMKLCELTGFSLLTQTSVATAISEIARCAIEFGKSSTLTLGIDSASYKKYLVAIIEDKTDFTGRCSEAYSYARRLVTDVEIRRTTREIQIVLRQQLSFVGTLTESRVESFAEYFRNEPPISAYDELRRKNLMLQDLAEKLRVSEEDYRMLTDSLPIMMFSIDVRGQITYTNKWLQDYFGTVPKDANSISWQPFVLAQDYSLFSKDLASSLMHQTPLNGQYRFKEKTSGEFRWHMFSITPLKSEKEKVYQWIGFLVDINPQKQIDQALRDNRELKEIQDQLYQNQEELQQKVIELNRSNYELEQFAHLASHDLQEPLRKLFFYSDVLKKRYALLLDASGISMLNNMTTAANRMKELISDLLSYSQLQKQHLQFEDLELDDIIKEVVKDLDLSIKEKNATIEVESLPKVTGNATRLRQLFSNLLSNSLKYCKSGVAPHIRIMSKSGIDENTIIVRDNGIGFDDQYSEKIFGLFERLHTRDKFPGTGIGLSICKRIAELHNGKIVAHSVVNEYAAFEVTLPELANA
jgi:PAS domain S-box-containing protein